MGLSFRKSKSFGLFRVSFSPSGIGLSFGVKGARISTGKRGTFVNLGANGIYYRKRIDRKSNEINNSLLPSHTPDADHTRATHTFTTGDIENVTDVDSKDFIAELESKANKMNLFKVLGLWPSIVAIFLFLVYTANTIDTVEVHKSIFTVKKASVNIRSTPSTEGTIVRHAKLFEEYPVRSQDSSEWVRIGYGSGREKEGFIRKDLGSVSDVVVDKYSISRIESQPWLWIVFIFLVLGLSIYCWQLHLLDVKRMTLALHYDLDKEVSDLYKAFLDAFREFASCKTVWQNLQEHHVHDRKYHGGAAKLISRIPVGAIHTHKLPSVFLKTNVCIPCVILRGTELYFFPERIIVKRGNQFGAIFYKNIEVESSNVRFIEDQTVPSDATIVDYTWRYLNKSGGPDRRFSGNSQIPICSYTEYSFKSDSGLHEVITTSKTGGMDKFTNFLSLIGKYQMQLQEVR